MSYRFLAVFAVFTSLVTLIQLVPATAVAQYADDTEYVEADEDLLDGDHREDGVYTGLDIEGNFNLVSNQNVVDESDGTSLHIGAGIGGSLDWVRGDHVVRNSLEIDSSWARTPSLDTFVKNSDNVDIESIYNFYLTDWVGPYARAKMETSAFPTHAHTAEETDYAIIREDGTVDEGTTTRLRVAEAFRPISLFESLGAAFEPIREETLRTSFRLGIGARQTIADGVLVVQDETTDDGAIEVHPLSNTFQAGTEAFAGVEGEVSSRNLSYRAGATALVPVVNNDDTDRSALELTRLGFSGQVRIDVASWLGVTYRTTLLDDPQLLDELQIQNSVLLTLNYTLVE